MASVMIHTILSVFVYFNSPQYLQWLTQTVTNGPHIGDKGLDWFWEVLAEFTVEQQVDDHPQWYSFWALFVCNDRLLRVHFWNHIYRRTACVHAYKITAPAYREDHCQHHYHTHHPGEVSQICDLMSPSSANWFQTTSPALHYRSRQYTSRLGAPPHCRHLHEFVQAPHILKQRGHAWKIADFYRSECRFWNVIKFGNHHLIEPLNFSELIVASHV